MNLLSNLYNGIKSREPVTTASLIKIILLALMAYHLFTISQEQMAITMMAIEGVLAYWLRGQVYTSSVHNKIVNTALSLPEDSTRQDLKEAIIQKDGGKI